jgi:hypothetical protein
MTLRQRLFTAPPAADARFRWRSREPSRLEGFSDAVFAFAMTLLVVSLEPPRTFDELTTLMQGFVPFAVTFSLLVWIWHEQYLWFRRYALDDGTTTVLTMVLLFVIMFFIYPLKFFSAFTAEWLRIGTMPTATLGDGRTVPMLSGMDQVRSAMGIYSLGYGAIFTVFAGMYAHAFRRRLVVGLSLREEVETRFGAYQQLLHAAAGFIAAFLAFVVHTEFAMFAYFLIPPVQVALVMRLKRRRLTLPVTFAVAE